MSESKQKTLEAAISAIVEILFKRVGTNLALVEKVASFSPFSEENCTTKMIQDIAELMPMIFGKISSAYFEASSQKLTILAHIYDEENPSQIANSFQLKEWQVKKCARKWDLIWKADGAQLFSLANYNSDFS